MRSSFNERPDNKENEKHSSVLEPDMEKWYPVHRLQADSENSSGVCRYYKYSIQTYRSASPEVSSSYFSSNSQQHGHKNWQATYGTSGACEYNAKVGVLWERRRWRRAVNMPDHESAGGGCGRWGRHAVVASGKTWAVVLFLALPQLSLQCWCTLEFSLHVLTLSGWSQAIK